MKGKLFVAVCCFLGALLLFVPATSYAKRGTPDWVVEKTYGDNNTGGKILFAFATKYGSTYKIAEVMCEVLSEEGFLVDLKFAKNVVTSDFDNYDAVILGSNIYVENWNVEALTFLETYKTQLASKKVAYFCVCAILGMDLGGKEVEYADNYVKKITDGYPDIVPVAATAFAGAVDYHILKLKDWMLLHLMFLRPGNWTDYAAVVSWTYDVMDKLK